MRRCAYQRPRMRRARPMRELAFVFVVCVLEGCGGSGFSTDTLRALWKLRCLGCSESACGVPEDVSELAPRE
jgi:hypothetical protein